MPKRRKIKKSRKREDPLSYLISSYENYRGIEWLPTGIVPFDLICGGGVPVGRFVEVVGDPATCKTVLGLAIAQAAIDAGGAAAYIDPEGKVDKDFALRIGVDWKRMVYRITEGLQDTLDRILGAARRLRKINKKGPIVIVLDSIGSVALDDEIEKIQREKNPSVPTTAEVGKKARALTIAFPSLLHELGKLRCTLVGINHLKIHMGAYFRTFLESPGGRTIWYHATIRVLLRQIGKIKNDYGGVSGIKITMEAIKNHVSSPYRKADDMTFDFKDGFDRWRGAAQILAMTGRIKTSKGKAGWFVYRKKRFRAKRLPEIVKRHPEILEPLI